ncbi:hypothetical protein N7495_002517 [Penicillium taxi]|uniref:uncharacterized protein n=1 Tax=Penicillium taxi TaxID=168475 RepID=UPI0025456195|nr:uncharacterized protein N7495_002517 [Penicillium taxi]KAJ5901989.1 hypothetical protein N7495_002517 [Penicillium taxi]
MDTANTFLLQAIGQAEAVDEKRCSHRPGVVASSMRKHRGWSLLSKIRIINVFSIGKLSEIKLKRTDTTLDLSQLAKRAKEEKKEGEGKWEVVGL